jgi:hypothetical protein
MSILGPAFRLVIENRTGQTISAASAIQIKIRQWKFDTSGQITFQSSPTVILNLGFTPFDNPTTVANLGFLASNVVENYVDKYIGAEIELTVSAPASSNGNVILYLDRSIDSATFSDVSLAQVLGDISFTTTATKRLVVHL